MAETPWEPKLDAQQTRDMVMQYRMRPSLWDDKEDDIKEIEKHAQAHRIPFARTEDHQESAIVSAMTQFGMGWGEGFTTVPPEKLGMGGEPETQWDSIARSLGHLAGFVGYIPGGAAFKTIRALNMVTRGKSIPLRVAKKAGDLLKKKIKPALESANPQLLASLTSGSIIGDVLGGAFHLGVASAVSSWTHGIDEMLKGLGYGAMAGGAFRAIGNVPGFGKRLSPSQLKPSGAPNLSKLEDGQKIDLSLRTLAGSLFVGLPATLQDATTEEQVYNYLLGAFFGYHETPYRTRISREMIHENLKKKYGPDPELNPNWDKLTTFAQKETKRDFIEFFGEDPDLAHFKYKLFAGMGVNLEDLEKLAKEYDRGMDIDPLTGEVYEGVKPEEIKAFEEYVKDNPNSADMQDLDMHINDIQGLPGRIAGKRGFVNEHISTEKDPLSTPERLILSNKINKKWVDMHENVDGVLRPKQGAESEILDFIRKETGKALSKDAESWWRNWAEQTRKLRPVLQIAYVDGEIGFIDRGVNSIGNRKKLLFQPPHIEEIYSKILIDKTGNPPREPFYAVWDHVIIEGKEYDFVKGVTELAKELKQKATAKKKKVQDRPSFFADDTGEVPINYIKVAEKRLSDARAEVFKYMDEIGYHYTGGKGDNARLYFVKKHPYLSSDVIGMDAQMRELYKAFREVTYAEWKDAHKELGTLIKAKAPDAEIKQAQDKVEYYDKNLISETKWKSLVSSGIKNYKEMFPDLKNAEQMWKQAYLSNAMYDVSFNIGTFDMNTMGAGFRKALGNGYINNPKAYNKRAQIWWNTGLSVDPNYVTGFLNKLKRNNPKIVNIKDNKWRIGLFRDHDLEHVTLRTPAGWQMEASDGAILALPEVIDALNKSGGLPTEGRVNKSFIVAPDADYGAMLGKYMVFQASGPIEKMMRERGIHMMAPESSIKQKGDRIIGELDIPSLESIMDLTPRQKSEAAREITKRFVRLQKLGAHWLSQEHLVPIHKSRIGEIWTLPQARGKGYGAELVDTIEDIKRLRGDVNELFVKATPDSVDFWKSRGYKEYKKQTKERVTSLSPDNPYQGQEVVVTHLKKALFGEPNATGPIYKIPISSMRNIMSEITDAHSIAPAMFPKQMWSTISLFGYEDIDPRWLKDMSNELTGRAVEGEKEYNDIYDEHLSNPNSASQKIILNNLDNISIHRIMDSLLDTNNEPFSAQLYAKILRVNREISRVTAEESELSRREYEEEAVMAEEFDGLIERIDRLYPEDNLGPYLHKFSRGHRFNAIRNYIVNRIERPKIKNSGTARMRPYDLGLRTLLPELELNDKIFYLDEGWKGKVVYDPVLRNGSDKLGRIWTDYQKGEDGIYRGNLDRVKEVLESVIMRVPMDSMSGANVLDFKGFTGVKGYGVLLHPRVMRALGGADLDGDKAFVFFGGEGGMHTDWKKIYDTQRNEYVDYGDRIVKTKTPISKTKGVNIMRGSKYGNPFVVPTVYDKSKAYYKKKGFIRTGSREEAIERYDAWLRGTGDKGFRSKERDAILEDINSGKLIGKTLKYFKPDATDSHAVRLARLIDEATPDPIQPQGLREPVEKHNKDAIDPLTGQSYGDMLREVDPIVKEFGDLKFSQYDPTWRYYMSMAAASGRDVLGYAVVGRASMIGAYNAMRMAPTKEKWGRAHFLDGKWVPEIIKENEFHVPMLINKKVRYLVYKTKMDKVDLQRFRELSRAAIAIGSDPMDEAGIKNIFAIRELMFDTLFDIEVQTPYKMKVKGKWIAQMKQEPKLSKMVQSGKKKHLKNRGLHQHFGKVNSVLYGRNPETGRKFSFGEIQDGISRLTWLPKESKNSIIPMLADKMNGIPFEDNLFRRMDFDKIKELYKYNKEVVHQDKELMKWFERAGMGSRHGPMIDEVMRLELYTHEGRVYLANKRKQFEKLWNERWFPKTGGRRGKWVMGRTPFHLFPKRPQSKQWRLAFLEYKAQQAEEFLVNDLSDMAAIKHIWEVKNKYGIDIGRFQAINRKAVDTKNKSYLIRKERLQLQEELEREVWSELDREEILRLDPENEFGLLKEDLTAGLDQAKIDEIIRTYKKVDLKNNIGESELFDAFMLGTFSRTNMKRYNELKTKKKLSKTERWLMSKLEKYAFNTSLIRLGYQSEAIPDKSIRAFLKEYNKLYKSIQQPTEQESKEWREAGKKNEKNTVTEFRDSLGNKIKGDIVEASDLSETDRFYLDDIAPFIGVTKGKIKDPELREIYYDLKRYLNYYHNLDSRNLNGWFRGIFGKDINAATKYDLQVLRDYFKEMQDGSWFRQSVEWLVGKDPNPTIKRAYYWMFPTAIDRDLMRHPGMVDWIEDVGPYKDRFDNTIMGRTVRPTAMLGTLMDYTSKSMEHSMQEHEKEVDILRETLRPFVEALPEGDILHGIAVAVRERGMVGVLADREGRESGLSHKQYQYVSNYDKIKPFIDKFANKKYSVPFGKEEGGTTILSGKEIWQKINEVYNKQNKLTKLWINGDKEYKQEWLSIAEDDKGRLTWSGLEELRKVYTEYVREKFRKGERIPIEKWGIDGMVELSKRILMTMTPHGPKYRNSRTLLKVRDKLDINRPITAGLPFDVYFPHVAFDRKVATLHFQTAVETIKGDTKLTRKEKKKMLKNLFYQHQMMTGDWLEVDEMGQNYDLMQEVFVEMAAGRTDNANKILRGDLKKAPSMWSRASHIGGWSTDPQAYESYMKSIVDTFYKQTMQVISRVEIDNFNKRFYEKTKDSKLSRAWSNFFKLWTQQAMGYPVHIPQNIIDDPLMKIKGTAFKWFADSNTKKRIDSIRKKLGIQRKTLEGWDLDEQTIDELSGISYSQLQGWGALEAKYELAALLAHPKSSIANLYGGTIHTVMSTGLKHLRNARKFEYLKSHINPDWKSMADVEKWVKDLGIIEEFLIYEAGINPKIRGRRWDSFIEDVVAKLKKDPKLKDTTLLGLKNKHKLTDGMWNFAASFMRIPERVLRRDAFMAHYLQAREKFGGAIKRFDHPFLITMAKKGVKATQFLYSAPHRPMFSNSTLGRVFARFQLWSWNSVRFRNDVMKAARLHGFQEGTEEFDRFRRMATADFFMLSLSNLFMFSLFENALPAPWNWFQDITDSLFGDDAERERAFYGHGPIQIITPPILRLLPPLFKAMANDDWSRLTDYYLWTVPPFGRLMKDTIGPGGMLENPFYGVEKFIGLPYISAGQIWKGIRKGEVATEKPTIFGG